MIEAMIIHHAGLTSIALINRLREIDAQLETDDLNDLCYMWLMAEGRTIVKLLQQ